MDKITRATLYLGANIKGVPGVTDTEFSLWLDDSVTPKFPGFTVRETLGYWRGKPEQSWELVILGDEIDFREVIEDIGRDYKAHFSQEAVLVSFEPVSVEWV